MWRSTLLGDNPFAEDVIGWSLLTKLSSTTVRYILQL